MSKYILYSCVFCPFSRKVRFLLDENLIPYELKEMKYWLRENNLIKLNPAGETPILKNLETGETVVDSFLICSYLSNIEKNNEEFDYSNLIGTDSQEEYEIQRLHMWFDKKFYTEITKYLIEGIFLHTFLKKEESSNIEKINIAIDNLEKHIAYIEFLLTKRKYLAGNNFSIADIAAAVQISILDYIGLIKWEKHLKIKQWYIMIKQKKGFNNILKDKIVGFKPYINYKELDF